MGAVGAIIGLEVGTIVMVMTNHQSAVATGRAGRRVGGRNIQSAIETGSQAIHGSTTQPAVATGSQAIDGSDPSQL